MQAYFCYLTLWLISAGSSASLAVLFMYKCCGIPTLSCLKSSYSDFWCFLPVTLSWQPTQSFCCCCGLFFFLLNSRQKIYFRILFCMQQFSIIRKIWFNSLLNFLIVGKRFLLLSMAFSLPVLFCLLYLGAEEHSEGSWETQVQTVFPFSVGRHLFTQHLLVFRVE